MRASVRVGEYLWRPLTDSDADTDFVVRVRNNPRFAGKFYSGTITPETHHKFIRAADERDEINWMIQKAGEPLGLSAIYHIDRANRRCECGRVVMLEPKLFHMNWMVSAFTAIDVIGLHRLYIETLEQNTVVARALERIGMAREGLMLAHVWQNEEPKNVWLFSGSPTVWNNARGKLIERFGQPQLVSYEGWKVT